MNKKEFLQERLKGIEYIQSEKCARCHQCCEGGGCAVLPMDIEPFSVENVMKEIRLGKYSISLDVISHGVTFLTLNARDCDSNDIDIFKPRTRCALLTEKGCGLSKTDRPAFALAFVPGNPCKHMISEEEHFKMWAREQTTMEQVVRICSGGKSSLQVLVEHFDKTAKAIYEMLVNKTKAKNYSDTCKAAVVFGENLYTKIIRLSDSTKTTKDIVTRLVTLEADLQTAIENKNGHEIANVLLHEAYCILEKPPQFASVREKIETCLKYNDMYL